MTVGSANVLEKALVAMETDGPCRGGTLQQLETGVAAKPMQRAALAKVRSDALDLLGKVLSAYTSEVAPAEVGAGGSGCADSAQPRSGRNPTGLLYGRIQS